MLKKIAVISLAFFILSGNFNSFDVINNMPIDITMLAIILPIAYFIVYSLINFKFHKSIFLLMILLFSILATSLFVDYEFEKSMTFIFILSTLFIISPVILNSPKAINLFFKALLVTSLLICLLTLVTMEFHVSGRLTLLGSNPIWLGRAISIALIIMFILYKYNKINILLLLTLLIPVSYVLIATGSKAPFFAAIIVILFLYRKSIASILKSKKAFQMTLNTIIFSLPIIILIFYILPKSIINRLFNFEEEGSTGIRLELYGASLDLISSNPLGIGIGNFSSYVKLGYNFPHNLFLESLVELGWFSGIILISFIILALFGLFYMQNSLEKDLLLSLFILGLLNSMFSGDMTSPKELYILLPIGLNVLIFSVKSERYSTNFRRTSFRSPYN